MNTKYFDILRNVLDFSIQVVTIIVTKEQKSKEYRQYDKHISLKTQEYKGKHSTVQGP